MWYVTMTDKALSGWGGAKGKISKLVFVCETIGDADVVEANANARSEMKYINVTRTKPYYAPSKYVADFKTKEDAPNWYKAGYFRK